MFLCNSHFLILCYIYLVWPSYKFSSSPWPLHVTGFEIYVMDQNCQTNQLCPDSHNSLRSTKGKTGHATLIKVLAIQT